MDTTQHDQRIATLEKLAEQKRAEAEAKCREFLAAATEELSTWAPASMKKLASAQHAVTAALGEEGIRSLKSEVAGIGERMPMIVETTLGTDALWQHRLGFRLPRDGSSHTYEYNVYDDPRTGKLHKSEPNPLAEAIRRIIETHLLPVARKYKFDCSGYGRTQYPEFFHWPDRMFEALRPYRPAFSAYEKAARELDQARHEKGAAQAADLWDKTS
jgi:hypothetical protein